MAFLFSDSGVLGFLSLMPLPLLHLLDMLEFSLLRTLGVFGVSGLASPLICIEALFVGAIEQYSSPAIREPDRAVDSVGARPESLFD
jgi:hypothetical protein